MFISWKMIFANCVYDPNLVHSIWKIVHIFWTNLVSPFMNESSPWLQRNQVILLMFWVLKAGQFCKSVLNKFANRTFYEFYLMRKLFCVKIILETIYIISVQNIIRILQFISLRVSSFHCTIFFIILVVFSKIVYTTSFIKTNSCFSILLWLSLQFSSKMISFQ